MALLFKFVVIAAIVVGVGVGVFAPLSVFAQGQDVELSYKGDFGLTNAFNAGRVAVPNNISIAVRVGDILKIILGLIALASMLVFIYGGALWMTAQGDEEQVKNGKNYIQYATIGIVVAFGAFVALSFVTQSLGFLSKTKDGSQIRSSEFIKSKLNGVEK